MIKTLVIGQGTVGKLIASQLDNSVVVSARDLHSQHSKISDEMIEIVNQLDNDSLIVMAPLYASKFVINSLSYDEYQKYVDSIVSFNSLRLSLIEILLRANQHGVYPKVVWVSSTDVKYDHAYGNWQLENESHASEAFKELLSKDMIKDYRIVRLPALIGRGIRKNAVYDIMNDNTLYDFLSDDELIKIRRFLYYLQLDHHLGPFFQIFRNAEGKVEYLPSKKEWNEHGLSLLYFKSLIETENYLDVETLGQVMIECFKYYSNFDENDSRIISFSTIPAVSLNEILNAAERLDKTRNMNNIFSARVVEACDRHTQLRRKKFREAKVISISTDNLPIDRTEALMQLMLNSRSLD